MNNKINERSVYLHDRVGVKCEYSANHADSEIPKFYLKRDKGTHSHSYWSWRNKRFHKKNIELLVSQPWQKQLLEQLPDLILLTTKHSYKRIGQVEIYQVLGVGFQHWHKPLMQDLSKISTQKQNKIIEPLQIYTKNILFNNQVKI